MLPSSLVVSFAALSQAQFSSSASATASNCGIKSGTPSGSRWPRAATSAPWLKAISEGIDRVSVVESVMALVRDEMTWHRAKTLYDDGLAVRAAASAVLAPVSSFAAAVILQTAACDARGRPLVMDLYRCTTAGHRRSEEGSSKRQRGRWAWRPNPSRVSTGTALHRRLHQHLRDQQDRWDSMDTAFVTNAAITCSTLRDAISLSCAVLQHRQNSRCQPHGRRGLRPR